MQGAVRLRVELVRNPLDVSAPFSQAFMLRQEMKDVTQLAPGVHCVASCLEGGTVPISIIGDDGDKITTVIPKPDNAKSFQTMDEQMADTAVSDKEDDIAMETLRASVPLIRYPVMMYDKASLLRLTVTHMDTGDDMWSGTFAFHNPLVETSVKSEEPHVKMEEDEGPKIHEPEAFLFEGPAQTVHMPLWHNLQTPYETPGIPEGQVILDLQRVCHADSGERLAFFNGECTWAIRRFAFATYSHRFGL